MQIIYLSRQKYKRHLFHVTSVDGKNVPFKTQLLKKGVSIHGSILYES